MISITLVRKSWREKSKSVIALLLVSLAAAFCEANAQQRATPVGVDEVRSEPMSQTIPILGRFVSPQSGVIAARSPGPVALLHVQVGDHVDQGDVLVELDRDRSKARMALQEAELKALLARQKSTRAKETYARRELKRISKLRKTAAFSQYDYDMRVQELDVASSSREEAEAQIVRGQIAKDLVEIELRDGIIRAPFPGVVTLRHTSEGAWLRVGDPVVTLVNDVDLEIEADVPAERLGGLLPGTQIEAVLAQNNIHLQAQVRAVIPDEDPAARTRPVRFSPLLNELKQALAINQSVTLMLPSSATSEVVSVAKDAVIRKGAQAMVYLVKDGTAQPRPVQLGEAVGNRFQVLQGLAPGDVVVVRGNERLRPGQNVSYPGQPQVAESSEKQG